MVKGDIQIFNDALQGDNVQEIKAAYKKHSAQRDRIRGCLFGGAAGDALGYAVEFIEDGSIFNIYGTDGITEYARDSRSGKALISDDTQMTLFTANGLLVGDAVRRMSGTAEAPREYAVRAYLDWLYTQTVPFKSLAQQVHEHQSWLCDISELYARRAPGSTCLSALAQISRVGYSGDNIKEPINGSKGCGGVMRIAPVALNCQADIEALDAEAAQIAAITHGHSLGYMPAAVLCHIINRIVFPPEGNMGLKEIILEAKQTAERIFAGDKHLHELSSIIERAISLAESGPNDIESIKLLGQGWVAEEALAIALYCSLKHSNDFSAAIIAAVNHSGDSDSTGAITGNIMGALMGYVAIDRKWKAELECADVILEMADDICRSFSADNNSACDDSAWISKYINMRRSDPR